jgi:hypothetical protein
MKQIMTALLVICYGIAWAWPAPSAWQGLVFLLFAASLLTLPFFIAAALRVMFLNLMIAAILSVITVIIPPFAIISVLFGIYCVFTGLYRLIRALPLIAGGGCLYGILSVFICVKQNTSFANHELHGALFTALVTLAMMAAGCLIMVFSLWLFCQLGYEEPVVAATSLGLVSYVVIYLASTMLGGGSADDLDGDD